MSSFAREIGVRKGTKSCGVISYPSDEEIFRKGKGR